MAKNSYESLQEIVEHENRDYPVGVYYVEPGEMFMEHVRWHWHTECELDVIKEGSAEYLIDNKNILLRKDALHLFCRTYPLCHHVTDLLPHVSVSGRKFHGIQ